MRDRGIHRSPRHLRHRVISARSRHRARTSKYGADGSSAATTTRGSRLTRTPPASVRPMTCTLWAASRSSVMTFAGCVVLAMTSVPCLGLYRQSCRIRTRPRDYCFAVVPAPLSLTPMTPSVFEVLAVCAPVKIAAVVYGQQVRRGPARGVVGNFKILTSAVIDIE